MPRANDPLACFLYLLARNEVPWGKIEGAISRAFSDVTPEMPADDPVVKWATETATALREAETPVVH